MQSIRYRHQSHCRREIFPRGPDGGEIIVALDINCRTGGNFVMQTNRYATGTYRGCAFREYNRVVIYWNDGARVSYSMSIFRRATTDLTVA